MFPKFALITGGILAMTASAGLAQNFPNTYGPSDYTVTQSYAVGNVDFNNSTGSGSDPWNVNPVDFKTTDVTLADSSVVEMFDICAEMFVGPTGSSTYNVSEGFGSLSAGQANAARVLFSNTLGDFIVARNTLTYDDASTIGAAIQLAFWEIAEDSSAGGLTLDDGSLSAGDLSIIGFAGGYTGTTAAAVALAETYLTNIRNVTWTDQSNALGYTYYYADSASEQDRLWVTVPEPSTALLSLVGMAALVLRRRR